MDHRCLVLSGRLLDGQDAATVHARMAAAFGMEQSGFRERVFLRAPLIIRRTLDDATAQTQAAQLRDMGVEADVWPDTDRLVWLRRDAQIRGPLPADALDHYAQAGDQWCHDGGQTWFAWTHTSVISPEPPPLPAHAVDEPQDVHVEHVAPDLAEHAAAMPLESSALPVHTPDEPQEVHVEHIAPYLEEHEPEVPAGPPPLPAYTVSPHETVDAADGDADVEEHAASVLAEPPPLPAAMDGQPVVMELAPAPIKKSLSIAAVVALLLSVFALLWYLLSPLALLFAICTLVYLRPRPMLRGRPLAIIATILSIVALGLWMRPSSDTPVAAQYQPRPLKPLTKASPVAAAASCEAAMATPKNDEDRFLLTGQRLLTGRAQRKGDTYVAEAAASVDAKCQPSGLQLYVFHHGVFIGTALGDASDTANAKLTDFDLVDDQHLRVTLAQCSDAPASCAATTVRQFAVMPGGGGWTLGEMK